MSMNITLSASMETTLKNGKKKFLQENFGVCQTPTNVTYAIMAAPDPKEAYLDYIKSFSKVEKMPIYEESDIFGEREPIGFKEYSFYDEHKEYLENWLKEYADWDIEWSYM
jgi:hypothetical protein